MKKLFLPLGLIIGGILHAQLTNTGQVVITNGAYLVINGLDIQNNSGAVWKNESGKVYFGGSQFVNDGTMTPGNTAETHYTGNNDQYIRGNNEHQYGTLVIDQPASASSSVIQEVKTIAQNMQVNDNASQFEYKVKDPAGSGLELDVNNTLTLNGNLRLYDDSQLLQTATTAPTGSGKLYRDQIGTGNKYWYNLWCAPVNNGGTWTVNNLMDGRDPNNPQAIVFEHDETADGSANVNSSQNPAHLNEYWIWKFENSPDGDYSYWTYVGSSNAINTGVGYTMKGPDIFNATRPGTGGSNTEFKAYTFAGLPNNGSFSFTIDAGNDYLIGNPYPSALSVDNFINDNTNQFNGALYFWEHVNGSSHYLDDYTGGYAVRNLTGGVPAKDWQTNTTTVGTKTPSPYVPVAQGFFVIRESSSSGSGTVTLQNSQRAFIKEDGNNSVFMRNGLTDLRLHFIDPAGGKRQLLLGIRPQATFDFDWGWDAYAKATIYHGDMFFKIGNRDFVIQAIPSIDRNTRIPLHVITTEDGTVSFGLDELLNFPAQTNIYIEDTQAGQTYQIDLTSDFTLNLSAGDYPDRFYLVFRPADDLKTEENITTRLDVFYNENTVIILNPDNLTLDQINVYDLSGKAIISRRNVNGTRIEIPVHAATGIYIADIQSGTSRSAVKFLVE